MNRMQRLCSKIFTNSAALPADFGKLLQQVGLKGMLLIVKGSWGVFRGVAGRCVRQTVRQPVQRYQRQNPASWNRLHFWPIYAWREKLVFCSDTSDVLRMPSSARSAATKPGKIWSAIPEYALRLLLFSTRNVERVFHFDQQMARIHQHPSDQGSSTTSSCSGSDGYDQASEMEGRISQARYSDHGFHGCAMALRESREILRQCSGFGPQKLGSNSKYVFSLPPRFLGDFSGYDEVMHILSGPRHPLHAPCGMPEKSQ